MSEAPITATIDASRRFLNRLTMFKTILILHTPERCWDGRSSRQLAKPAACGPIQGKYTPAPDAEPSMDRRLLTEKGRICSPIRTRVYPAGPSAPTVIFRTP